MCNIHSIIVYIKLLKTDRNSSLIFLSIHVYYDDYGIFHIVDQTELDNSIGKSLIQNFEYNDEEIFVILVIIAVSAVFQLLDLVVIWYC